MDYMYLIILTVLYILPGVLGKAIEHIFVSGCTDEEMSIKCPDNHKIAIKRLFYGVKKDRRCGLRGRNYMEDCCIRTHSDCIVMNEREYGKLNSYCSGFPECSYNVTVKSAVEACPDMSHKYTDYMTIIYDCIPDDDVVKFCTPSERTAKSVYLANSKYPYPENSLHKKSCQCSVRSGLANGITIEAIDIMIRKKKDICHHAFRIHDSYGIYRHIACGQEGLYGYRSVYERMVANVTLTLDIGTKGKCFVWIHIKVQKPEDYLIVSCDGDPTAPEGSVLPPIAPDASVLPPTVSNNDTSAEVVSQGRINLIPDMVAIIGGICAASALIIVICIVAIAVHCTRIREQGSHKTSGPVISSPVLITKKYDGEKETERFNYDEERYCSIKRNPIKLTKYTDLDAEKDKQLKEAFLQGTESEEKLPIDTLSNSNTPPSENPELPYIIDPPASYQCMADNRYFTMNPQKPQAEVAQIKVTSSLPHRGKKAKNKDKSVTFSPVAMVTPFPYGSDESVGSNGERNIANIIDSYQNLHTKAASPDISKFRKVVILPPTAEDIDPPPYQCPDQSEMAEVEALWKSLQDTTTMDDGAYDNIDYLLSQNKAKNNQNKIESGV
ncbi:uncharacterized protein LOC127724671 [Mytilus californianus]|uniref:uncharacterized protein LOC127724671 n=1 Tax=Mytilus californianus TaxID=6549 RepID=UPI00224518D8|nr:uncharacterized protein LOC127724671 [Mytilus californianus]XP_052087670.1 uncharacterized protein LOC127724671 [Mytilus californianus]